MKRTTIKKLMIALAIILSYLQGIQGMDKNTVKTQVEKIELEEDEVKKNKIEKSDDNSSFCTPIAKIPMTWKDINDNIDFDNFTSEPNAFGRSQESHDAYEKYKVETKTEGIYPDLKTAILAEKFEKTIDQIKEKETRLKPNRFPSYLAEGIGHYLLWIYDESFNLDPTWVQEEIRTHINDSNKEFVWAKTPEGLRSVPELSHVHVFVKNNE